MTVISYSRLSQNDKSSIFHGNHDHNDNNETSLSQKYIRITIIVSLYWFISITMVFLNKKALNQVNAPFFITWFQCLFTFILLFLYRFYNDFGMDKSKNKLNENDNKNIVNKYLLIPYYDVKLSIIKKILPLSIVFVSMITFNNLSLKFVGVAFYFVVRSLTPVFNVLFSYLILNKTTSLRSIICCLGIIFGFAMGVDQEQTLGTLSFVGVICGVLASVFVSLNSIFVADILKYVDENVALLSYYNSLIAIVLFIPFIIFNSEFKTIFDEHLYDQYFWLIMIVAGIFGLFISVITNLQIKYTSPLTHNISGTAKACSQTIIATYVYNQTKTFSWWLSNIIVLISSASYTFVRQQEMKQLFQQTNHHDKHLEKQKNDQKFSKLEV